MQMRRKFVLLDFQLQLLIVRTLSYCREVLLLVVEQLNLVPVAVCHFVDLFAICLNLNLMSSDGHRYSSMPASWRSYIQMQLVDLQFRLYPHHYQKVLLE